MRRFCTRCAKEFGFAHPGRTFLVSLLRVEHLRQPSHAFMSTYFFFWVSPAKHIFRRIRFTVWVLRNFAAARDVF